MRPDDSRKLFNTYKSKMDAVSPDLKPEIQRQKKDLIHKEFSEQINRATIELQKAAGDFEKARRMYSDPKFMLVSNAVKGAENFNPGDAALIAALPGLSDEMLGHLIGQSPKAGVLLACLNYTQNNADLRGEIYKQVQLPEATIKSCAASELDCLNALAESPVLGGPTKKLDLGYR